MSPPIQQEGIVKVVARAFWRTWQFWASAAVIIVMCMLVGYLIGMWQATSNANYRYAQQERAYKEASDSRKAVLQQCLDNTERLSARLAAIGDKTADALNRVSADVPKQE